MKSNNRFQCKQRKRKEQLDENTKREDKCDAGLLKSCQSETQTSNLQSQKYSIRDMYQSKLKNIIKCLHVIRNSWYEAAAAVAPSKHITQVNLQQHLSTVNVLSRLCQKYKKLSDCSILFNACQEALISSLCWMVVYSTVTLYTFFRKGLYSTAVGPTQCLHHTNANWLSLVTGKSSYAVYVCCRNNTSWNSHPLCRHA